MPRLRLLIVDDNVDIRRSIRRLIHDQPDLEVHAASSLEEARELLAEKKPHLLLVDVNLRNVEGDNSGLDVLRTGRAAGWAARAVVLTGMDDARTARAAFRAGADDYILKAELTKETLRNLIARARADAVEDSASEQGKQDLVGSSPAMTHVRKVLERVAKSNAPVLVRGETGTGKELIARRLHAMSDRANEPFVAINCSAVPGPLFESLLFGHERGAFTGAERKARGEFENVGKGTLLLDEVGELPVELQAKLLRVLEESSFRPIGSHRSVPFEGRVVAATHVDLEESISSGRFRQDLFYRLNVLCVRVPPLAERTADIPELVMALVRRTKRNLTFTPGAMAWLTNRQWPGNVRELRNLIDRIAVLSQADTVDEDALVLLTDEPRNQSAEKELLRIAESLRTMPGRLDDKLDTIQRAIVMQALRGSNQNVSAAARELGIDRKALERRSRKLRDSGNDDE